jgi:hypothetical protein
MPAAPFRDTGITIRVPRELKSAAITAARRDRRTLSSWLEKLIADQLYSPNTSVRTRQSRGDNRGFAPDQA